MMNEIDARGLLCPEPLLKTQQAIEAAQADETIRVLVDDMIAFANVSRYAKQAGCSVEFEQDGDEYTVTLTKGS